ncbi:MAG: hypothetical protein A2172_04105 [Candidatus Woykebacteria bacterium RBG_13_40_15]|uniref:Probable inosine/xanthosine triphosphatase n=1 Tax=Candidatus Woykebacteria bacterium RBG_13_40_15 TaxID=1802593 RepID=A0A1G1W6Z4_9BACT|nr:MAG: hypothetical protein A2172_04105 [Candidatus Woykebacteria bacterium RBG_13_40_15]
MRVALGSTSPPKIKAVKAAFKKAFSEPVEVVTVKVPSGVSDQPSTDKETYQGAFNRATNARKEAKADFGVGIEGGIHKHDHGVFSNAWIVVLGENEKIGIGTSARFQLPPKVLRLMERGDEMGVVMDKVAGTKNIKLRGGAYSVLSDGKLSRWEAYEQGVLSALMPFLTLEYWD